MQSSPEKRRRWTGALFLVVALVMLVVGETVLKNRLGGFGFILFWLTCFLFTFAAIVMAFLDLSSVRRRTREEHRELFEQTLKGIERQKATKTDKPADSH